MDPLFPLHFLKRKGGSQDLDAPRWRSRKFTKTCRLVLYYGNHITVLSSELGTSMNELVQYYHISLLEI